MLNPYTALINKSDSMHNANYNWSFDDTIVNNNTLKTIYYAFKDTGEYIIKQIVINKYGCKDTAYSSVIVQPMVSIYIPNAFTPNADFINDYFNIRYLGIIEYKLDIFDRWGEQITSIQLGDTNGWNGKYKLTNDDCKQDVYIWKLRYKTVKKDMLYKSGTVTLIR